MAYFMVTTLYPTDKATEMGEKFLSGDIPELPAYVKMLYTFIVADNEIKAYAIYEVEDEQTYEGMKSIIKRYTGYFGIKGFKYKLEPIIPVGEALPMIGL